MDRKILCWSILLLMFVHAANAKKLKGVLETDSSVWEFLTRFCFLNNLGGLEYTIKYPKANGPQRLLFYYDTPGQWSFVYKRGKTCEEKTKVATDAANYFTLDGNHCNTFTHSDGTEWYTCSASLDFHSARERWWYLVIERCGSKNGLYLDYELHLTNGEDLLHREFSADEFYILPINIVFFIIYVIILILSICVAVILKKKTLYHTTYAMYMAAIIMWTIALLLQVIAWGSYASTGWEQKKIEVLGRILQAASTIIFMLMLILMAKGYTIVRGRLTNKATMKITIFIMLYIIMSIVLLIWEANIFDPGKVLFYYENPPGYCMIAIQLLGWLWMTKAAVFTLKHFSNTTAKFYIPFYIIFTIWFWLAPIIIMLAITAMPKWMREKTVHGVLQFVAFCGHSIFLILTRPSEANDNFPYHIKTSQIDIVGDNENEENNQYDGDPLGPRIAYSVNSNSEYRGTGPNLDIFITFKQNGNHNYSNGQAGYQDSTTDDRMYSALDPSIHSSLALTPESSNDVSPGYLQVGNDSELTTNNNHHNSNSGTTAEGNDNNKSSGPPIPPLLNHPPIRQSVLPPLGETTTNPTTTSSRASATETILPPIRGTGLPSLELQQSAPQETEMPPDYFKLFHAK